MTSRVTSYFTISIHAQPDLVHFRKSLPTTRCVHSAYVLRVLNQRLKRGKRGKKEGKTEAWSLLVTSNRCKLPLFHHTYPHVSLHFENLFLILQHTIARIVKHFKQTNRAKETRRNNPQARNRISNFMRIRCKFVKYVRVCVKNFQHCFKQRRIESR